MLAALLPIVLAACGGKESMASKSAAAYDAAQKNGGHAAAETPSASDHATMTAMDHATMDHAAMDHAAMDHAAMDHAQMQHGTTTTMAHSTMDHSQMPNMDHSQMPGMQHSASPAAVAVVTEAPRSSAEMARIQPGATLRADEFDAPAPAAAAGSPAGPPPASSRARSVRRPREPSQDSRFRR